MKSWIKSATLMVALVLWSAALAPAQSYGAAQRGRMYNTATEATFKGTVEDVRQGARGQMMGTHLTVKTDEGTREIALGPAAFIESKGFSFAKGDLVEITGSRVTMGGMEFFIAREVVKDGKTLTLRDKDGRPEWTGRGAGRRGRRP